jgi:hypothetical protein
MAASYPLRWPSPPRLSLDGRFPQVERLCTQMCTFLCTVRPTYMDLLGAHDGVVPRTQAFRDCVNTPEKAAGSSRLIDGGAARSRREGGEYGNCRRTERPHAIAFPAFDDSSRGSPSEHNAVWRSSMVFRHSIAHSRTSDVAPCSLVLLCRSGAGVLRHAVRLGVHHGGRTRLLASPPRRSSRYRCDVTPDE